MPLAAAVFGKGDELTQAFGLADSKAFCAIEWVTAGE